MLNSSTRLTGETWVLTTFNNQQAISEHQPTLQFELEQVSGNTGCNHYGGDYQINGDEISFEGIYSTEMACLAPAGLMQQEQTYLELLRSTTRFSLVDGVLTIFAGAEPVLIFEKQAAIFEEPAYIPATSTLIPSTATESVETVTPTSTPVFEPLTGYREYRDSVAGVSISIPESWSVTGVIDGQYAIFQSYPEDKYIGGEARDPADTKCDLNLHPSTTSVDELIQQWETDPRTSIESDEAIILRSGQIGRRFVIDSMGRSILFITGEADRTVVLTCYGDFALVDAIAVTLNTNE